MVRRRGAPGPMRRAADLVGFVVLEFAIPALAGAAIGYAWANRKTILR